MSAAYARDFTIAPRLREDRPGRGGDHEPFIALGFPAVRFIDDKETLAHQHSPDDIIVYVSPAYTARVARVVASVLASLALAPRAPTSLSVSRSGGRVTLAWEGAADHYVVTARSESMTSRPGVVGRDYVMPAPAKPTWISVSAVDSAGHESLAAWPEHRCDAAGCGAPVTLEDAERSH
jgi:hypothetical protein